MKRELGILTIILSVVLILGGCKSKNNNTDAMQAMDGHQVKVKEFVHTSNYTYFKVTEGKTEYWLAAPRTEAKVGETLFYTTAWEMKDFESTELNRTFDQVLFVQDLNKGPKIQMGTPSNQQAKVNINTEGPGEATGEVKEEITIHELMTNPGEYANKLVKVSGKVTKVNPAIMNRNWVHLTSEPADGHNHDLTITTQDNTNVDEVITIQGQVSIDRDFGAGYRYALIIENAKLITK